MTDDRWWIEPYDPDVDDAEPGSTKDCDGAEKGDEDDG